MKKLIVAASALMLTGAMVSTAAAEVTFSGDAYARYYMQDNWTFTDGALPGSDDADSWRSRVRLKMKGTTASGAFAAVRFEMDNDRWGEGNNRDEQGVSVDYAYISVPVGCVNITAGDWDFASGLAGWHNDTDVEAVAVAWANDATTVTGLYAVSATVRTLVNQEEDRLWGVVVSHNFDNAWNVTLGTAIVNTDTTGPQDFDRDDHSGVTAQLGVSGQAGPVALAAEFGYQEDGLTANDEANVEATDHDGYGFFVSAGMDFDAVNVTFVAGTAQDGYAFDAPVGFIMIGGDSMLSPYDTIGSVNLGGLGEGAVDNIFAGFKTSYQATEALGLGFNLAYADLDGSDKGTYDGVDGDAWEVSASMSYALADGVSVTSELGYLDIDVDDNSANIEYDESTFGAVVSLNLTF